MVVRGEVVDWVFVSSGSMPLLPVDVLVCGRNSHFPSIGDSKSVRGFPSLELGRWEEGIACA